jgi:hypothetical protein
VEYYCGFLNRAIFMCTTTTLATSTIHSAANPHELVSFLSRVTLLYFGTPRIQSRNFQVNIPLNSSLKSEPVLNGLEFNELATPNLREPRRLHNSVWSLVFGTFSSPHVLFRCSLPQRPILPGLSPACGAYAVISPLT